MTDERFVFQEDIKERSKMKTGAFHKKSGAKSKKCTMPSDYLTPKQKKKLSGSVESISLAMPITSIKELRTYTESLQIEYLQNCITAYGARRIDLIKMLNSNGTNFRKYCERHNILLQYPSSTGRGRSSHMDERWQGFIAKLEDKVVKKTDEQIIEEHFGIKLPPIEEQAVEQEPVIDIPVEEETVAQKTGYNSVLKMKLDLKGTKEEILFMMNAILGDDCNYIVGLNIVNADREESA